MHVSYDSLTRLHYTNLLSSQLAGKASPFVQVWTEPRTESGLCTEPGGREPWGGPWDPGVEGAYIPRWELPQLHRIHHTSL